jgi:hypothetical protein
LDARLDEMRFWDGSPLPTGLRARLQREWEHAQFLHGKIVELEGERRLAIAHDRGQAVETAIALARTFGTRGRVLIPPEDLGPKGDLNDWLRVGAKRDLAAFRSIMERALATSPTPWALQIQRLAPDLAPWDLEDHSVVRDLLCELGHQGALSHDAHLRLLAERCRVALATLREAAREWGQSADGEL